MYERIRRWIFSHRLPEWSLRLGLYTAIAIALTWPLVLDPEHWLVGGRRSDVWNSIWGLWFAQDHGVLPSQTTLLDHPDGGRIVLADPLNAALAQLLLPVTTPVGAYGVLVMGHLIFAGLMADRLGRECGGRGWTAGVAYQLAPVTLGCLQSGTSEAMSAGWLPLACLTLIWCLDSPSRRNQVLAGFALALVAIGGWYAGVGAWLFVGAVIVLGWGPLRFVERLKRLGVPMGIALAFTVPLAAMVRGVATGEDGLVHIKDVADLDRIRRTLGSADPRSFWMPGDFRSPDFSSLQGNPSDYLHAPYLGYVLVGLAVWAWVRGRERARSRAWWLAIVLGVVLAMGPVVVIDGKPWDLNGAGLALPLPYRFLEELPGFSSLSLLFRLAIIASLGLAILADRVHPLWAVAVAAEVALISPVQGMPLVRELPDYAPLGAITEEGAVLNLPPDASEAQLYEQVLHGRPITGSLNTGLNATALELLKIGREVRRQEREPAELHRMARELNVRWVVLHKNAELKDPWVAPLTSFSSSGEVVAEDLNTEVIRLRWPEDPPPVPDP